jgi:phosphoinositide-3-kinase regulatory subunit 4
LTTLAVGSGPEKHWLAAGTSRGYIAVWDLRFQLLVRLWRHSSRGPVHRLATCARLPEDPDGGSAQPLAFVAAGVAELAVWNLNLGGPCRRAFRSVRPQQGTSLAPLPTLDPVPLPNHPGVPVLSASEAAAQATQAALALGSSAEEAPSVRAIVGRISTNGNSYLITGSTDKHIRFWDLATPTKCFTVSGLEPGQV